MIILFAIIFIKTEIIKVFGIKKINPLTAKFVKV
jgi:hypothetical protein